MIDPNEGSSTAAGAFVGEPDVGSAAAGRVSCVLTSRLIALARRQGVAIDGLIAGSGENLDTLMDPTMEISWPSFLQVCRNGSKFWSTEELVQLGRDFLQLDAAQPLHDTALFLNDPVECYSIIAGSGRYQYISCVEHRLERLDHTRLRIQVRMAEGCDTCSEYFLVRKGFLEVIPTILGLPPAVVELVETEFGATFEIELPPGSGIFSRLRIWSRALRGRLLSSERSIRLIESLEKRHEFARDRIKQLDAQVRKLSRSEELFTSSFKAAPVSTLIYRVDDLKVVDVNDEFLASSGFSRDEIMAWTPPKAQNWVIPGTRESVLATIMGQTGGIDGVETRLRHRDGHELIVLLSAKKVDIAGEECVLWQAIDVTSHKHTERELAMYRDQLEEILDDRTRELERSHASLQQAERLASIGTLSAGIAHEINNPIAVIRAASEFALLSSDRPDAEQDYRSALETCVEQTDRCGDIVRNILRFARGESGTRQGDDLRELVIRSCNLVGPYARENGIRIEMNTGTTEVPVLVNALEIEQVLVNLLRNAIEASSLDSLVEVCARHMATHAFVEIRDHGPGISEDQLPFLFDPFYTTRLETGGTGLGLSVAHGIIQNHHGFIRVTSENADGAAFQIHLPIHDPNATS